MVLASAERSGHYALVASPSADDISRAIVMWTGYKIEPKPSRDDEHFAVMIGADAALDLLPIIRQMQDEFYESDAYNTMANLDEMAHTAAAEFRTRRPELSDEAIDALAWCYAWDWK
jgi:hypothetical protein